MWFRNLLVYRFTQDINLDAGRLSKALAAKPAKPCASGELFSYGFSAPLGKGVDAPLVHESSGFLLISASKEERLLPGAVVKDALKDKIEEIETAQMRKVYRKEREQMQDEIVQSLLPRAFIRRSQSLAAIAPKLGLLLVNGASASRAEELLSTLREAIGSLPLRPVAVKIAPSATLTDWLKNQQASEGFTLQGDCELRDTHEDGGLVRCQRQDLAGEEIQLHLASGKIVTQLALDWQEKLTFVLDEKLVIKRLRFADLLTEQAASDGADDALAEQDASFSLMMLTLSEFLPALFEALGGEELPAPRS